LELSLAGKGNALCVLHASRSLLAGLASLLVDLHLPSFSQWLSLHFAEDFITDVLQRVYSWFPCSDNLALVLLSKLHHRKKSNSISHQRQNMQILFASLVVMDYLFHFISIALPFSIHHQLQSLREQEDL
jgi:hypothetical protein